MLLMLLAGGLGVLVLFYRRPELCILAVVPFTMLVGFQIGTGTNISLNVTIIFTALLCGLWIFNMLVFDREIKLVPSRVNLPAILLIIAIILSFSNGSIPGKYNPPELASLPAQAGAAALYILSIGGLLLVGNHFREMRWLRGFTWMFIMLAGLYILSIVIPYNQWVKIPFSPGIGGSMLWVWLAALSTGQALFNRDLKPIWRVILGLLVLAELLASWIHGYKEWVSGWFPTSVAILAVIWLRSRRLGVTVSLLLGIAAFVYYLPLVSELMSPSQTYSISSRGATLPIMWELIKSYPIFGMGPANYYYYTQLIPLMGYYVRFNSHNNYVDILAQTGLVGFTLFGWLMFEIGRLGLRLREQVVGGGFTQGYVNGVLGGLAGMLVSGLLGDWFMPFLYNIGITGFRASIFAWFFLGGLIAVDRIHAGAKDVGG